MGIVFSVEIPDSRRGERTQIAAYSDSDGCEKHQKILLNGSSGPVRQALFAPGNFGTAPNSIIALSRRAKTPLCKDMHCRTPDPLRLFRGQGVFSGTFFEDTFFEDRHCSGTWREDPVKMVPLLRTVAQDVLRTGIAAHWTGAVHRTGASTQQASGRGPSREAPCKHGHCWSYSLKSLP